MADRVLVSNLVKENTPEKQSLGPDPEILTSDLAQSQNPFSECNDIDSKINPWNLATKLPPF